MSFPTQREVDFTDPKQHLVWALRNLKWGQDVALIPQPILEAWSEHLVKAGAVHIDFLRLIADEDGKVDLNDLPGQVIEFRMPEGEIDHPMNANGEWVNVE